MKREILIVDDDEAMLDTFKELLTDEGYNVATSGTGANALKQVNEKNFSVTLLDINLPDMDGFQLLTQIHALRPKTMNIMATGYPSLSKAASSLNLGAVSYVIKPINPDELLYYINFKLDKIEHDDKSSRVIDNTLPVFFDLLSDGSWKSTGSIAESLGVSKVMVEKTCVLCARTGLVNYWPKESLVKIGKSRPIIKAS